MGTNVIQGMAAISLLREIRQALRLIEPFVPAVTEIIEQIDQTLQIDQGTWEIRTPGLFPTTFGRAFRADSEAFEHLRTVSGHDLPLNEPFRLVPIEDPATDAVGFHTKANTVLGSGSFMVLRAGGGAPVPPAAFTNTAQWVHDIEAAVGLHSAAQSSAPAGSGGSAER